MMIRSLILVTFAVGGIAFAAACGSSTGTGGGSSNGGSTGNGMGGSSGTAMCAMSCADAITNGGTPCSSDATASSDYSALTACAGMNCGSECPTFMNGGVAEDADAMCPACVMMMCGTEATACSNN
jgi:hypothetical protein